MCMRNIMIKCAGCQHKKEFLSFKSKFTYPIIFVTTPVQKEQPEIMSVYELLVFVLTVM